MTDTETKSDTSVPIPGRSHLKSFGADARKGLVWLTGSRAIEQAITFAITILLARLLTPADYGLLGMATLLLTFLGRFADFGTAESIVQVRDLDDHKLSSIFWFNLAAGLLFGVVMLLLAPVTAAFFREPDVQPVVAVLALTLPLQSLTVVPDFLLRRRLQFDRWVVRNLTAIIIAGGAGVTVALAGGGVWALVTQQLAAPLISGTTLWLAVRWRPRLHFQRAHILEIKDFTTGVLGFNLLNYFSRNIDYLLIGRFLTPTDLGLYTLAYRLMRYPTQFLSSAASQALFPVFSRMQDDPVRLGAGYIRIARYISFITFPIMVGMALTSNDLIAVLFGTAWMAAAPVLTFLALGATLQPVAVLFTSVIWALGLSQWQLRYAVFQVLIVVLGFIIGLQWGIVGMSASYTVTALISSGITIYFMFPRCRVSRRKFVGALSLPIASTAIMGIFVIVVPIVLMRAGYWPEAALFRLLIQVSVGAMVYLVVIFWREPKLFSELHSDLVGGRRVRTRSTSSEAATHP